MAGPNCCRRACGAQEELRDCEGAEQRGRGASSAGRPEPHRVCRESGAASSHPVHKGADPVGGRCAAGARGGSGAAQLPRAAAAVSPTAEPRGNPCAEATAEVGQLPTALRSARQQLGRPRRPPPMAAGADIVGSDRVVLSVALVGESAGLVRLGAAAHDASDASVSVTSVATTDSDLPWALELVKAQCGVGSSSRQVTIVASRSARADVLALLAAPLEAEGSGGDPYHVVCRPARACELVPLSAWAASPSEQPEPTPSRKSSCRQQSASPKRFVAPVPRCFRSQRGSGSAGLTGRPHSRARRGSAFVALES